MSQWVGTFELFLPAGSPFPLSLASQPAPQILTSSTMIMNVNKLELILITIFFVIIIFIDGS